MHQSDNAAFVDSLALAKGVQTFFLPDHNTQHDHDNNEMLTTGCLGLDGKGGEPHPLPTPPGLPEVAWAHLTAPFYCWARRRNGQDATTEDFRWDCIVTCAVVHRWPAVGVSPVAG